MALSNIQLGSTETTICAAGSSETRAVLTILFCNTDTSTRTITLYAYPSSGSAGDSTTIVKTLSIPALDTYLWTCNEKFILGPSDKISGLSDVASKVTATANYYIM